MSGDPPSAGPPATGGGPSSGKGWDDLPADLHFRILRLLPISDLLRLLPVSRSFRTLLRSSSFHALLLASPVPDPFFLLFTSSDDPSPAYALAFRPSTSRFLLLPIPSSPPLLSSSSLALSSSSTSFRFLSRSPPRPLPPIPPNFYAASVIPCSSHFIVLAVSGRDFLRSMVYDSRAHDWTPAGGLDVRFSVLANDACIGGRVFFLARLPDRLLAFDIDTREWEILPTVMPVTISCATLFSWSGGLFLIGGIEQLGVICKVVVWEMEWEAMGWQELCYMPERLFKEFGVTQQRFYCFTAIHGEGMVCLFNHVDATVMLFDVSTMEWRRIPECDLIPKAKQRWYGHVATPSIDLLEQPPGDEMPDGS